MIALSMKWWGPSDRIRRDGTATQPLRGPAVDWPRHCRREGARQEV